MLFTSCLLLLPKSHKPQSYQIQECISQDFMYFPPPSLFPVSFYAPTLSGHT